jgi:hypothetical protein
MTRRGTALFVTACAAGALLGAYAGSTEPAPVYPLNTVTTSPWLDGCTTDADCAAMDDALRGMGRTLTEPDPASILALVLPYWQQPAPDWCAEDDPCWIGSLDDDRSPQQILDDLPADLIASVGVGEPAPELEPTPELVGEVAA